MLWSSHLLVLIIAPIDKDSFYKSIIFILGGQFVECFIELKRNGKGVNG